MAEGLPLDKVRAVLQASDGYLWVATFNGLARFDGVRFRIFTAANTPELRNDLITCLFEDRQQQLWIGSETGEITVCSGDGFKSVPCGSEWRSAPIQRFVQGADETVWTLNRLGWLLPFKNANSGSILRSASPLPYEQVCADSQGDLWVSQGGMLLRLPGAESTKSLECPPASKGSRVIFPSRRGGFWIIEDNWVRRWDQGQWVEDRGRHQWRRLAPAALLETRAGQLVVGTLDQGLDILEADGHVVHLDSRNGLAHDWIGCLCEDYEQNLWVGTGGGLNVLRPRRVMMVNAPDQWQGRAVLSVTTNQ
ncbi:MAG TPA: two-component regulator propeller domain-containing protein, partial [Bacillota bacterium]|nr:two-component regulator propeller domain-containing protein [Bacillota bacterium]